MTAPTTPWWRRLLAALGPRDLVQAQRRIAELEEQADSLRQALDDSRARESAAKAVADWFGRQLQAADDRKERALRVLRGTGISDPAANQEAQRVLMEYEPADPDPDARARHQAHLAAMLKETEWQVNRDYGSAWLAAELYDRGARAPYGHTHPETGDG